MFQQAVTHQSLLRLPSSANCCITRREPCRFVEKRNNSSGYKTLWKEYMEYKKAIGHAK